MAMGRRWYPGFHITVLVVVACLLPVVVNGEPCRFTVTNDAASGSGSLHEALELASASSRPCRIEFGDRNGFFAEPRAIVLDGPLPTIQGEVVIDGFIDRLLWRAYGVTISGAKQHHMLKVSAGGNLTLRGVTLRDGLGDRGGAIINHGRLLIDGSSLLDNQARESGGAIFSSGEAVLINSTLIGNVATEGGAVASAGGSLRIVHATFHGNRAERGGAVHALGGLGMANSIVSGSGNQCRNEGPADDMIHNLIHGDHHGCGEPILTVDPLFERLAYYNGPTMTLSLSGASPAINQASTEAAVDEHGERLVWDQRGNGDPRFAGGYADLGAFERQGPLPEAIEVNVAHDNGLRVCTGQGQSNCPLPAAIDLAVAGRNLLPIRFDSEVFDRPSRIQLNSVRGVAELPLVFDGSDQVMVEIEVPCEVAWRAGAGVSLVMPNESQSVGHCHD